MAAVHTHAADAARSRRKIQQILKPLEHDEFFAENDGIHDHFSTAILVVCISCSGCEVMEKKYLPFLQFRAYVPRHELRRT